MTDNYRPQEAVSVSKMLSQLAKNEMKELGDTSAIAL